MIARINRFLFVLGSLVLSVDSIAGPSIESWTTDAGARVLYVQAPEIPMFDVRVTFAAGSARDGEQKGVANITSALLTQGTDELDANAFSDQLGATGAKLSTGARRDMAYLGLRTMAQEEYSVPALALMEAAMARPRFAVDAIDRLKARAMIAFRHKQQSPGAIIDEAFYADVYGEHPYGSPPDGNEESVAALKRDDFSAFHQRHYVARNMVIAIVGALDKDRAQSIATRLSAALPQGEAAPALPEVLPTTGASRHIEFSSIQSHVRVGLPGMRRGDADYFPLLVGNHALGGNSLVSLLFKEIRSKRGLSYSASSHFTPMAQAGPFVATLQTDRSQQDEAVRVLNETLADFVNNGPPDDALKAAKQNLVGGFPLRIDSNQKITEYLAMIGFYKLPLDYLDTFTTSVAAVTSESVRDAFKRRLVLDQLVTVIVGRAKASDDS
jgi:zinc protease